MNNKKVRSGDVGSHISKDFEQGLEEAFQNYSNGDGPVAKQSGLDEQSAKLENIAKQVGFQHYFDLEDFMVFGEEITWEIQSDGGLLLTRVNPTYSHTPTFFQKADEEIVFQISRTDTWITIGGNAKDNFSAVNFNFDARPNIIRFTDFYPVNAVDITITKDFEVDNYVKIKWNGDNLEVYRSDDNQYSFELIATVNVLTEVSTVTNWIGLKNFGTVAEGNYVVGKNYQIYGEINTNYKTYANYTEILQLKQGEQKYTGETCGFGGDSITAQALYISEVVGKTGATGINYGLASSTLAINNTYLTNLSLVERIVGLNGNVRANDEDNWFFLIGANDWLYETPLGVFGSSDNTTFHGAIKQLLEDTIARSNNPIITFATMYQCDRNGANGAGITMEQFNDVIRENCKYYGVPLVELYYDGGINPINLSELTQDGVHLNNNGAKRIGAVIASRQLTLK